MNENKKVFFIVNKFSGAGHRDSVEGRIINYCASTGLEPDFEFTRERGHAIEIAKSAVAKGFERVFAVGGDGTVNEVAQALVNTNTALGILPRGSGNGLARHLRIPMRFARAIHLINSSKRIRMDSLLINERMSFNVSGIGFDGHVAAQFGKNGKRGLPGYARLVLREFKSFKEFQGRLSVDGAVSDIRAFIVAIANASQFGNNARVAPVASICDGVLDVCVIRKVPILKAVRVVNRLFNGTIAKSREVTLRKGRQVQLILDRPIHYHIDGEPCGTATEFNIRIVPGNLNVIVPETGSTNV